MKLIENTIMKVIKKVMPNIDKLIKLSNAIDAVETTENGSLYIKYKKHVIEEYGGGHVSYSEGLSVIKSGGMLHINPVDFKLNLDNDIDTYVLDKTEELKKNRYKIVL